MRYFLTLILISTLALQAMNDDNDDVPFSHNTYQGKVITPESLLVLASKMPDDLEESTEQWMDEYQGFVSDLVTTPHPLTHANRIQKTKKNNARIKRLEQQGEVKNLSGFNYVLRFKEYPNFTVPINTWGSRMAYLRFAYSHQNILKASEKAKPFDCSQFEGKPSYQHCSRAAHYLRLKEIIERKNFQFFKTTPTCLKHIPNKPPELSDENYVVVQKWVPDLKELKELSEREQLAIRKNIPAPALQEIYEAVVYAALWDIRGNLAVSTHDSKYYMLDLEEPFNHLPQFFYFQGDQGKRKYVLDVIDGLERMAQKLVELPEQFNLWERLTDNDTEFKKLCEQYQVFPNYDLEHLRRKD